jgi:hypothetical protein
VRIWDFQVPKKRDGPNPSCKHSGEVMKAALVALAAWLCALPVDAKDHGQWGSSVSPELKAWFNSVRTDTGSKCCDEADGYPVEYEMRPDNHYWIHFQNEWLKVPEHAVRRRYGNPTGGGVVWFLNIFGAPVIHCFVPTDEF